MAVAYFSVENGDNLMTQLWLIYVSVALWFGYHPPVHGRGIPSGTVILDRSGDLLTLSNSIPVCWDSNYHYAAAHVDGGTVECRADDIENYQGGAHMTLPKSE